MPKLTRDEILRGLIQTLVDGWGHSAVQDALDGLGAAEADIRPRRAKSEPQPSPKALEIIENLDLPSDRKPILAELAKRFDEGRAFPKLGDIKSFLLSHHRKGADLKGRLSGFNRMLPILVEMSPKGLEKLLTRSQHSGPADLAPISDAIRGAGENLRGNAESARPSLTGDLPLADQTQLEIGAFQPKSSS